MEDKNRNLENFFRKKLSSTEGSGDGWDKPDAEVWEQAQTQIPVYASPSHTNTTLLKKGVFALLLLLLAGYIWSLHQQLDDLTTTLNTQQEQFEKSNNEHVISEKIHATEKAELLAENDQLQTAISLFIQQKTILEQRLQQQQITQLTNSGQTAQNKTAGHSFATVPNPLSGHLTPETTTERKGNTLIPSLPVLPHQPITIESPALHPPAVLPEIIPPGTTRHRFEIGYAYSLTSEKIPSIRDFKDLNSTSDNKASGVFNAHSHGLHFAFSPRPDLYIRTGFQKASFDIRQDFKTGLIYDKSNEYTKPNGGTGNDLALDLSTPYAVQRSNIGIDIPDGTDLETGDLLVVYLNEYQNIQSYQVPLGIQYFFGDRNLQWYADGGIQWNKMVFDDYKLVTKVQAKNQDLPVDKVEVFTKPGFSKQFFTVFAGAGLDYRLSGHWHARAGLAYHLNLIKNKSKDFSNTRLTGSAFNLGLNYRF